MAELALGIAGLAGTIDVCIKFGKFLVEAYKDYGQTDTKLNELSARIQVCWSRIFNQLEVTRQLEGGMSQDERDFQLQVLRILQSKLDAAVRELSKSDKYNASKLAKRMHFLSLRDALETTITDLESWQKRFEPSWFEMIKVSPSVVNAVLRDVSVGKPRDAAEPAREALKFRRAFESGNPIFITESTIHELETSEIPYCSAHVGVEQKHGVHIIDTVSVETVKSKDARELAYRLRDSNPVTFGMLRCKGIVKLPAESAMAFVFRVPDGYNEVHSVRELLLSGRVPNSLTMRLEIARQLINAVYYVHLYDFVHKNITPETILSLETRNGQACKTLVCLVGFQIIRFADAKTNTPKTGRKDNLYQHPSRKGNSDVDFVMQHDIYSLGVCLLEIGLWESLVIYGPDGTTHESGLLGPSQDASDTTKDLLVALSRGDLRARMGDTYSRVVETCLTCLDKDNTDFGDPEEFQDEDGVEVGSRYVKKVMDAMSTILY